MTNAGWYPDPAGAPDTYRYWDGQAWSQMTTTNPGGRSAAQQPSQPEPQAPESPYGAPTQFPPQGQAPQQGQSPYGAVGGGYGGYGAQPGPGAPGGPGGPGGYGQPSWNQGQPSGGGNGKTIGIVIAAVLALVLVGVGGFFGVRALTSDDDDSKAKGGDDESSETTDNTGGTDDTTGPTDSTSSTIMPTGIQCTGGRPTPDEAPGTSPTEISGGGLTIPVQDGYTVDIEASDAHSFADDVLVQYKLITDGWVSEFAVGALPRDNGYTSTDEAAEIVMQCLTMNDRIYRGFDKRTPLKSESIEVDGKPGHLVTSEIRVKDSEVTVEGDVTTVIVVDTGDSTQYGVFLGVATIGQADNIALVEQVVDQIKVN